MDDEQKGFIVGFIVGAIVTILIWICVIEQVEMNKVEAGYLTLKNKTYTVTLYDSLDIPEQEKE